MTALKALGFVLKRADAAVQLVALLRSHTGLTFTDDVGIRPDDEYTDDGEAKKKVVREGFGALSSAISQRTCADVAVAMRRLDDEGLPPLWVYLANEPWRFGESICARVSRMLGYEYALVADAWAWVIPRGSHGWPPHRGNVHRVLDREAPEIVNVWLALDDVDANQAAMHVVVLDEDPGYPHELTRLDVPPGSARVLPVRAGTALLWNANMLHWGGECSPEAVDARLSCSFTLVRVDSMKRIEPPAPVITTLDLASRVELIARQIVVYGAGQRHVTDELLEWARAACAMQAFGASRRS